jgi:hypothetical protein
MFSIYSKKQYNAEGMKLFHKLFDQIQVYITDRAEGGHAPVSNQYWMRRKMKFRMGQMKYKMPQIHYPIFSKELAKLVKNITNPDENLASFVKELKDLIKLMIEDEQQSNSYENKDKYDRLKILITDKIRTQFEE